MATTQEIVGIMASGGSFILSAQNISEPDLRQIASAASQYGVTLTIKELGKLNHQQCRGIASAGGKRIIFDLT